MAHRIKRHTAEFVSGRIAQFCGCPRVRPFMNADRKDQQKDRCDVLRGDCIHAKGLQRAQTHVDRRASRLRDRAIEHP